MTTTATAAIVRQRRQQRQLGHKTNCFLGQRRVLVNIGLIFRDQPQIYTTQCEATISRLSSLRCVALSLRQALSTLPPDLTHTIKPYACIAQLHVIDALLSEVIITTAMFQPVCEAIIMERVQLHLKIRLAFPSLLSSFDNAASQLVALQDRLRQEAKADAEGCLDG